MSTADHGSAADAVVGLGWSVAAVSVPVPADVWPEPTPAPFLAPGLQQYELRVQRHHGLAAAVEWPGAVLDGGRSWVGSVIPVPLCRTRPQLFVHKFQPDERDVGGRKGRRDVGRKDEEINQHQVDRFYTTVRYSVLPQFQALG